ncbi:MAG TPA: hypothetical protein VN605_09710 [Thermoanaerobaculia bacterium]|nr:hypothetical protein [Thermoanaerobaculia bacterium]
MRTVALISVLLAVGSGLRGATTPAPVLTISGNRITASGMTPRSSVFFFGVAHERRRFTPVVLRVEKMIVDDDGDGTVVFDYGKVVPGESVWAAIDMTDGRRVTGTPAGAALPLVLQNEPIVANNGQLKQILVSLRACHLLLVRPAVGVWGQVLVAGNKFDTHQSNDGGVSADVSNSIPAQGLKVSPPIHLEKVDVIVLIDPVTLRVFAVAVGEKL